MAGFNNSNNFRPPSTGNVRVNPVLDKLKKSWGNFAPLGSRDRGAFSNGSSLTKRLDAMKRKPLPPLRPIKAK